MTVVIEKTATGYSAYVEEVPGIAAAGSTMEETQRLIREGLVLHFEANPEAIPLVFKTTNGNGITAWSYSGTMCFGGG
jgi:predicted RNase H-like HicB family nuclease